MATVVNKAYTSLLWHERSRLVRALDSEAYFQGHMLMHDDSNPNDEVTKMDDSAGAATDKFAGVVLENMDPTIPNIPSPVFVKVARKGLLYVDSSATIKSLAWQGRRVFGINAVTVGQDSGTGGGGAATNNIQVGTQVEHVDDSLEEYNVEGFAFGVLIFFNAGDVR